MSLFLMTLYIFKQEGKNNNFAVQWEKTGQTLHSLYFFRRYRFSFILRYPIAKRVKPIGVPESTFHLLTFLQIIKLIS